MPAGNVSGGLIADQRETLGNILGPEGYEVVMRSVPAEVRAAYEGAISVGWVPTDAVDSVVTAAAHHLGKPVLAFHAELTRRNMENTLGTIWRVLLRFTSDSALIQRTPLFYRKTFDVGSLEGDIPEPGHAVTTLRGYPDISDIHITGLRVGIESVLSAAGRQNVRGRQDRTADGAIIECWWTKW
jgi:hypothetical protein